MMGLMLLFFSMATRAARRRRRRMEEEAMRRAALERQGNGGSPFAGSPFGTIFDSLLFGPGGWSRSLELDPETGEWVDVTDRPEPAPKQAESPKDPQEQPTNEAAARSEARPRRRARARPARRGAMGNPRGGLLGGMGGMGGDGSGEFEVQPPEELVDFDDVGGMESLKREVADTVGLMLQHPDDAERYGIEWNGILLHGPPGVGKTFVAQAIAGEYRMNFIHVSTGDLVAGIVGKSAQNIEKAFETADRNLPCLLFFDEFDSVAQRRDNTPDQEARRTVNQLLTSLEAY